MTHVMDMKEVLCMFMTTVIKCHFLNYDIVNANMTMFEMSLLRHHQICIKNVIIERMTPDDIINMHKTSFIFMTSVMS